jgi:hypothetical protein
MSTSSLKNPEWLRFKLNRLERHADAYSPPPDHSALLSHVAVEQFKALRQRYHREYLDARAAWGIVNQSTGDHWKLGIYDDLRDGRLWAGRLHALI